MFIHEKCHMIHTNLLASDKMVKIELPVIKNPLDEQLITSCHIKTLTFFEIAGYGVKSDDR